MLRSISFLHQLDVLAKTQNRYNVCRDPTASVQEISRQTDLENIPNITSSAPVRTPIGLWVDVELELKTYSESQVK